MRRIVSSAAFSKSPRLRDFLLFVSEQTLSGHTEVVNEIEIARQVFGRGEDFVPSDDSLVRVSARQLRAKLKEYFDGDGKAEPILIDIPKGAYIPVFVRREGARHPGAPTAPRRFWKTAAVILIAVNAALLGLNLVWSSRLSSANTAPATPPSILASLLLAERTPVQVVVSDFGLSLLRYGRRANYGLEAYSAWNYDDLRPPASEGEYTRQFFELLRSHRITRLGDLTVVLAIQRASAGRIPVYVRHSRDISIRDFKRGRHIVLGNPYSTPWVSLFEDGMNFESVRGVHGVGFHNRHPRASERDYYTIGNEQASKEEGVGYARIAYVPNTSGAESVLIVGGVNMVTMEAGGDFIADPNSVSELLRALALPSTSRLPYFEVVLETNSIDNVPQKSRIVAARVRRSG